MRRRPAMSSIRATSALAVGRRGQVLLAQPAPRGNPVGQVSGQPRVFARAEGAACSLKIRLGAETPVPADHAQRRRAVVEAEVLEVVDDLVLDQQFAAAEVAFLV